MNVELLAGGKARLSWATYNADNEPEDAADGTLRVFLPGSTYPTGFVEYVYPGTVTRDSLGRYHVDADIPKAGQVVAELKAGNTVARLRFEVEPSSWATP